MPETNMPPTTTDSAREWAKHKLEDVEKITSADCITLISPMASPLEHTVKIVVEARADRRDRLMVILDTPGGIVEVVERIVRVFRHHYSVVQFLVPDRAMSAGTVLAMSGDDILMDYHSCLGPIDPQVEGEKGLVPALSYLSQYAALIEKSLSAHLSTAELVLLQKLDLAELHQFELAKDLSIDLLRRWLTDYKFKDWVQTETRQKKVTKGMKEERAGEIAEKLSDHQRWLTHGRGIDMQTLRDEFKLKIQDYGENPKLKQVVWDYFWFLRNYMVTNGLTSFVHSPQFF